ncbi:MAG: hypothetical protein JST38_09340 [Bacteroidetes bacterium]|nr:hypothetical protein [Bacteroidota bacterium]
MKQAVVILWAGCMFRAANALPPAPKVVAPDTGYMAAVHAQRMEDVLADGSKALLQFLMGPALAGAASHDGNMHRSSAMPRSCALPLSARADTATGRVRLGKAQRPIELSNDTDGIIQGLEALVSEASEREDFAGMVQGADQLLLIHTALGDSAGMASDLNLLSYAYEGVDPARAVPPLRRSIRIAQRMGLHENVAANQRDLGHVFRLLGQLDSARHYGQLSMDWFASHPSQHDEWALERCIYRRGELLRDIGDDDGALKDFRRIAELPGAWWRSAGAAEAATILLKTGRRAEALGMARKAYAYADSCGRLNRREAATAALKAALRANGRFEEALAVTDSWVEAHDSMLALNGRRALFDMELRESHRTDSMNDAIARQQERQSVQAALQRTHSQRNLVMVAALALLLMSALLLNRYRLKRRLQVEQLRTRLSRDLHDDIGATLSSINILSSVAQRKAEAGDEAGAAASLSGISERTQRLMRNMSDIVWSVDPGRDSMEELLIRMREFGAAVLEPKNIAYRFESSGDMSAGMPPMVKSNFYLIFKEAVNNAAKHADATEVSVCLRHEVNGLHMAITDNGKGMAPGTNANGGLGGNGLRNMRARAAEMKAELRIGAVQPQGTTIELVVPL